MGNFWSNVKKTDGCWKWTGGLYGGGYGRFYIDSKIRPAHVVSYEMEYGEFPKGLVIDHLCRNRKCVRPDHLEPKTFKENILCGTSFSAINHAKTHCINGHEFTEQNTYIRPDGNRDCRICIRARVDKYQKRKSA